jgi:hypothetical protein
VTISTAQITVGTARVLLAAADDSGQRVTVHNNESAQQVFLGGSDVTTSNGIHLDGKQERQMTLNPGESLYGIASNSYVVSVMIQKQD